MSKLRPLQLRSRRMAPCARRGCPPQPRAVCPPALTGLPICMRPLPHDTPRPITQLPLHAPHNPLSNTHPLHPPPSHSRTPPAHLRPQPLVFGQPAQPPPPAQPPAPPPPAAIPEPDPEAAQQLAEMGFGEAVVRKALLLHRNGLEAALNWLLQHGEDPAAAEPLTEEQLQQVGRGGAAGRAVGCRGTGRHEVWVGRQGLWVWPVEGAGGREWEGGARGCVGSWGAKEGGGRSCFRLQCWLEGLVVTWQGVLSPCA